MFKIILHHEVMKKAISLKTFFFFGHTNMVCLQYYPYLIHQRHNIIHIPFTRDTYFGYNRLSEPTIDPFSSHVDKPVHRIFYFPQRFNIYRNHRFRLTYFLTMKL